MSEYFPESKSSGGRVKAELDLCNYISKTDLKDAASFDIPTFATEVDLANLKSNVHKLDIDKLENVPSNLSNLKSKADKLDVHKLLFVSVDSSELDDVVKNDVVEKHEHNAKIKNSENKILDITNLATNTTLNAKTIEG